MANTRKPAKAKAGQSKQAQAAQAAQIVRVEGALSALYGMVDMGCRKAVGMGVDRYIDMLSRSGKEIPNPLLFSVLTAVVCMRAILTGEEQPHAPGCGIYQHPAYLPMNCTCGLYGRPGQRVELGFGATLDKGIVQASGFTLDDVEGLRAFVKEQVHLLGRDEWVKRGASILEKRVKELTLTRMAERDD